MEKKRIWIVIFGLLALLSLFPFRTAAKENREEEEKYQIIFLLDASKSMEESGQWESAIDSAILISSVLPEKYETALVVYNTEVVAALDFGDVTADKKAQLENLELKGYTNPGNALRAVIGMFREGGDTKKHVLFFSDGEISMQDEEATQAAVLEYGQAVQRSLERNIILDMILFSKEGIQEQISSGAELTSGLVIRQEENTTIEQAAVQYLFDDLGLEKIELGASQADAESLEVDLGGCSMRSAKVLLEAESEIEDVHISGQCEELSMIQGKRFAAAVLQEPLGDQALLDYTLSDRGKIHIYLVREYELEVRDKSRYLPEEKNMLITVDIRDHRGTKLLENPDAEKNVEVSLDGKAVNYKIKDGVMQIRKPMTETKKAVLSVDFGKMNSVIHCKNREREIELVVPEEEPDYTILWIVLAGLGLMIALLIYLREREKQKKNGEDGEEEIRKKEDEKSYLGYEFSGQIKIYVLKNQEEDTAPCSLRLYGRGKKSFSFDWVKDCCGICTALKDADKIRFYGGKNHTLCIKNHGYATIMKGNEIFRMEKKYNLSYGEKILFVFNNGEVEIELHYKNMKPSER